MEEEFGATALEPDEALNLKASWIRTRSDLNIAEAAGIAQAVAKYSKYPPSSAVLLDDLFLRQLHRDMFSSVWTWAGTYRSVELNLGINPSQVATEVRKLLGDVAFRLQHVENPNSYRALACELHHRLVWIHPFVNGNGRAARLYVDLFLKSNLQPGFTWGSLNNESPKETRREYVAALKAADNGDISRLVRFVTS